MKWSEVEEKIGKIVTERLNVFLDEKEKELEKQINEKCKKKKSTDTYKLFSSVDYKDYDLFGTLLHHIREKQYVNLVTGEITIKKIVLK